MTEPVLTIDIGGTKTIVGICTTAGDVLEALRADRPSDRDADWILGSLFDRIDRLSETRPEVFSRIRYCGIGFGGPVKDNRPVVSMHVAGWDAINLCAEIENRYGLETCMENDGVVQALGEHVYGAGRGTPSLIFANLGTGFGGGIVENGETKHGDGGFAGHLGHVCVVPGGRLCPCGNRGCAEAYCSGNGIGRTAVEAAESDPERGCFLKERIDSLPEGRGPSHALLELAREGDSFCLEIVDGILETLSLVLSAGVNILDIRLLVVGGGAGVALKPWFPSLEEKVLSRVMPLCRDGLEIRAAELGDYSLSLGAVALCTRRFSSCPP